MVVPLGCVPEGRHGGRCCRRHTGASRKCASRRIASAGPVCPSATTRPWDERLLFPLKLVEEPGAAEVYWWRNRGQRRNIQRPTVEIPRRWSPGDPGGRVEEEEGKGRWWPRQAGRTPPGRTYATVPFGGGRPLAVTAPARLLDGRPIAPWRIPAVPEGTAARGASAGQKRNKGVMDDGEK